MTKLSSPRLSNVWSALLCAAPIIGCLASDAAAGVKLIALPERERVER